MGHSHVGHAHPPHLGTGDEPAAGDGLDPGARRRAVRLLAAVLVPLALATVAGLALLWPSGGQHRSSEQLYAAPGVSFPAATVTKMQVKPCSDGGSGSGGSSQAPTRCGRLTARVADGRDAGTSVSTDVPPEVYALHLGHGDQVRLVRTPSTETGQPATYSFFDVVRNLPIGLLGVAFALVVVGVARVRGLAAIGGLLVAYGVLVAFMLPAILQGRSPVLVGLVGSSAILFVVLYLAHGVSARTTAALAGTLFGLLLIAGLGSAASVASRLTWSGSDENLTLSSLAGGISLTGVGVCGVIVAGLGVLNDVTITQASAVWELHALSPTMPARRLFGAAMRIGRDHIASSVYTIAFAYAGAALPVLLLVSIYQRPLVEVLTSEQVAEEVVRTLAGVIGLVLTVPVTTAVAVGVVTAASRGGDRGRPVPEPAPEPEPVGGSGSARQVVPAPARRRHARRSG